MVEKVLAEPSAAVGVAYVLDNPTLFYGKNVAVVISGGNIDLEPVSYTHLDVYKRQALTLLKSQDVALRFHT